MRASSAACRRSLKKEPLTICQMRSPAPRFYASLRNYRSVAHFRSAGFFAAAQTNLKPAFPRAFFTDKLKARVSAGFFVFSVILCNYLRGFLMFACASSRQDAVRRCLHCGAGILLPRLPLLFASRKCKTLPCSSFLRSAPKLSQCRSFSLGGFFRGSTDKLKARVSAGFFIVSAGFFIFSVILCNYLRGFLMFACAAARRAIGTRKGEQDT